MRLLLERAAVPVADLISRRCCTSITSDAGRPRPLGRLDRVPKTELTEVPITSVGVTFHSKVQAAELIARFKGWIAREPESSGTEPVAWLRRPGSHGLSPPSRASRSV